MFTEEVSGLGVTVTITTRFDPNRIRERLTYWLDLAAEDMAKQAREQINNSGVYVVDENLGGKRNARYKALYAGLSNINWVIRSVDKGAINSTKAMVLSLVKQLGMAVAAYWVPGIGWGMALYSLVGMFGGKKKKPYPLPWDEIYSTALPYAKAQTNKEELLRIEQEQVMIKETVYQEATKQSATAAAFKLPEGVTSISRGALVITPGAATPNSTKTIEVVKPYVWKAMKNPFRKNI